MGIKNPRGVLVGSLLMSLIASALYLHTFQRSDGRHPVESARPQMSLSNESSKELPPADGSSHAGINSSGDMSNRALTKDTLKSSARTSDGDRRAKRHLESWTKQLPDAQAVLGLHPEEYDGLLSILVEYDMRLDSLASSSETRDSLKLENQVYKDRTKAIAEYLGEAKNNEWLNYLATTGIRAQVAALVNQSAASYPISQDQVVGLLRSLIATNQQYQSAKDERKENERPLKQSMRTRAAEYEHFRGAMRSAAAPYLNSSQLHIYDSILKSSGPIDEDVAPPL